MNENSQNSPPPMLERPLYVLNEDAQKEVDTRQKSVFKITGKGISATEALSRVSKDADESRKQAEQEADRVKVDGWEMMRSRMAAIDALGKNIESAIGLFDGKHADALRSQFKMITESSGDDKSLKNLNTEQKFEGRPTTDQYPIGVHNTPRFNEMMKNLAQYIRPVLEEEGKKWEDICGDNQVLKEAFMHERAIGAAPEAERTAEDIRAANKRDDYVTLARELNKFHGIFNASALDGYNLSKEMKNAVIKPFEVTDDDKTNMLSMMKNSDLQYEDTYNNYLADLLRSAKSINNGELNPDDFSNADVKEMVAKINGESTVAMR